LKCACAIFRAGKSFIFGGFIDRPEEDFSGVLRLNLQYSGGRKPPRGVDRIVIPGSWPGRDHEI